MVVGFRYVLGELRNFGGGLTFNELAEKMDISKSQLDGMINMMEKMGYIEINDKSPSSSGGCTGCCGGGCGSVCTGIPVTRARTYNLTRKGEKVCNSLC